MQLRPATFFLAVVAAVAVLTLSLYQLAQSQTLFEKLVMPGELIEGHAKLEATCDSCHVAFEKGSQPALCLKCHEDVAIDFAKKLGFHGRAPEVKDQPCKTCHTDHVGRDAKIAVLDRETFKHELTDFLLKGKHASVKCESCHLPDVKFRKAPSACIDCHRKDDKHKGNLGTKCETCHDASGWTRVARFDHSKTAFPLAGAHTKVKCAACHAGEKYKGVPTDCAGCHKKDDVHKGRLGADCAQCHSVTRWSGAKFDHDRRTKFPLRGQHAKITCAQCHGEGAARKVKSACVACHKKDDAHAGQLGPRCENCHRETSWKSGVTFDHAKTRFPLRGLHVDVACKACHKSTAYKEAPIDCAGCHADPLHEGRLGAQCEQCHSTKGWPFFKFDHDVATAFPLKGAHSRIQCHDCHSAPQPASLVLPTDCYACHAADDVHRGEFGRRCERCHTPKSFKDVRQLQ